MTRSNAIVIADRAVGSARPVFIIAEIGINHNGDLATAKRLIDAAVDAGADAVKFQKRTPSICVPPGQASVQRDTPWGRMTYMEYRQRVEFGTTDYRAINAYCARRGIMWFASAWDLTAVDFMEGFNPPCYKIASASLTDDGLLSYIANKGRPVILSTGMSTMAEIDHAVSLLDRSRLLLAHCTSTYPTPPNQLNLRMLNTLGQRYGCPVGYSGHETGLQTTLAAVALGACFVERHITLDRSMWGSDQAASVEPRGLGQLVRDIRVIETALGDGVKQVYDGERLMAERLRGK